MKFQIGLSQLAYATRRGVTPKAVRKAIASGLITVVLMPDGNITTNQADRLWDANASPNQRHGKNAERATAWLEKRPPPAKFVLNRE
ncbi:hypothetical protein [Methylobacterium sp. J-068]|uniref:hypothetical protein n=1 Tax=Methylobacterium sp. J-068 TaxID=2836649 RepID=UPI001FBA2A20|nr:hypothetical protein [Methylobacterium sp. J-068]MCJ2035530.1 hypothetical protein [Methylobacterium sp. J-068]